MDSPIFAGRRHLIGTALASILPLTGGVTALFADRTQQIPRQDKLDEILDEWERQSSTRVSLDVRFRGSERDKCWDEEVELIGRIVLLPKGRASFDVAKHDKGRGFVINERVIWTKGAMHVIRPERRTHDIWPIDVKDRGRLPTVVALPFLWHGRIEGLKTRFLVKLVKEEPETWVLSLTPRSSADSKYFDRAFLWLDRGTFLPRRYSFVGREIVTDYRVTNTRSDRPEAEEDLRIPDHAGWRVTRMDDESGLWLTRLFRPALFP